MSVPFDLSKCVVCQRNQKPNSLYLCKPCAKEWGIIEDGRQIPHSAWPEWIKALVKEYRKWGDRTRSKYWVEEIPYDPSLLTDLIEANQEEPLP